MGKLVAKLSVMILPTLLDACAAPTSYAGIDLRPGLENTQLQATAQRAQYGDKRALLELGIAYEEGRTVPVDLKRARALYRAAASTTGGTIFVYQPPVRKGGAGSVMPVNMGPVVPGLAEAKARLKALEGRVSTSR